MKRIVLKLSGELFSSHANKLSKGPHKGIGVCNVDLIESIIRQINEIRNKAIISIVVGGGNFFRGESDGKLLGLAPATSHEIGMLATVMNGLILQAFLEREAVPCVLFSAIRCPQLAQTIQQKTIDTALQENKCLIFSGGTGNPFFTTDTAAVLRSLQTNATEIWKATKVDGIYDKDPEIDASATLIKKTTYQEALDKRLQIMDLTAITLAQHHDKVIRVFNLFTPDALCKAFQDDTFGSTIRNV